MRLGDDGTATTNLIQKPGNVDRFFCLRATDSGRVSQLGHRTRAILPAANYDVPPFLSLASASPPSGGSHPQLRRAQRLLGFESGKHDVLEEKSMTRRRLSVLCACGIAGASASLVCAQQQAQGLATNSISSAERVLGPVVAKLEKSPAVDLSGNPIGQIEEIVLSPTGSAQAAILIAPDKRLVPIPWTFLRATGDTNLQASAPSRRLVFTVTVDQARLGKAPGFAAGQWPDMTNPAWLQASAGFFGLAREEAVGGVGTGTRHVSGGAASSTQARTSETETAAATNGLAVSSPATSSSPGVSAQSPNRNAKPTKQP